MVTIQRRLRKLQLNPDHQPAPSGHLAGHLMNSPAPSRYLPPRPMTHPHRTGLAHLHEISLDACPASTWRPMVHGTGAPPFKAAVGAFNGWTTGAGRGHQDINGLLCSFARSPVSINGGDAEDAAAVGSVGSRRRRCPVRACPQLRWDSFIAMFAAGASCVFCDL